MPRTAIDYSKTIIYKIVCNDLNVTETYVGSTTNMVKRRNSHKGRCNNDKGKGYNLKIYQIIRANGGWDNWSVIQICEFPCNNQEEARTEERRHYELLNASLNMINPYRSQDENVELVKQYKKGYYEDNKDRIAEKNREYNENNRGKILDKQKIYYDNNKSIITEMRKEKYTCCCGSTLRKCDKSRHEKTMKHKDYILGL